MTRTAARVATLCLLLSVVAGCGGGSGAAIGPAPAPPPPPPPPGAIIVDLASLPAGDGFLRVSGAASTGRFGVPVAAGFDCDGDGVADYAVSNLQASPLGRNLAGQVLLIFGDGRIATSRDTAVADTSVLTIAGAGPSEAAGSEIWMDDVTGDGIGDLLIGRQNFREPASGRIGAGAVSVVVGGPGLRDLAGNGMTLDLAAPPPGVQVFTLAGAAATDRLGFWLRSGDLTGDGIADLAVGADQADGAGESNRGEVYVLRGGAHLNTTDTIDLAAFGTTSIAGHVARVLPPAGSADFHFGATLALADLDGNGRAELLVAASLSRVGGLLVAAGAPAESAVRNGGNPGGTLFILWADNFPTGALWPAGYTVDAGAAPGTSTVIDGGTVAGQFSNERFGEDILGGRDYDGDGAADLFLGDIKGTAGADRLEGGTGHLFFGAAALAGRSFSMSAVPGDLRVSHILGPEAGAISSDTSAHGDFDGDGRSDLVLASPLASPEGRIEAGIAHVLWGQNGPWPALIDLRNDARPDPAVFAITDIYGARGAVSQDDTGDTLMYSAAAADLDGDGRDDLVINEMRGNGVAATALDVGNLLVIGGARVAKE